MNGIDARLTHFKPSLAKGTWIIRWMYFKSLLFQTPTAFLQFSFRVKRLNSHWFVDRRRDFAQIVHRSVTLTVTPQTWQRSLRWGRQFINRHGFWQRPDCYTKPTIGRRRCVLPLLPTGTEVRDARAGFQFQRPPSSFLPFAILFACFVLLRVSHSVQSYFHTG